MNKALFAAAVAALGLGTACQSEETWTESAEGAEVTGETAEGQVLATSPILTTRDTTITATPTLTTVAQCEPPPPEVNHDLHLAAIATLVLQCGHEFHAGSFSPQDPKQLKLRILWPTFECKDEKAREALENLLGLQYLRRSGLLNWFGKRWREYQTRMRAKGYLEPDHCPVWHLSSSEDEPTQELIEQLMKEDPSKERQGLPAKAHHYWKLEPTELMKRDGCESNRCILDRAKQCSSLYGNEFWETTFTNDLMVKTDPSYWKDNTNYGSPDFFDTSGWVHGMATSTGWAPGDIWGAPMRSGENCTYYATNMIDIFTGSLQLVNCGGGWMCASECKATVATTTGTSTP